MSPTTRTTSPGIRRCGPEYLVPIRHRERPARRAQHRMHAPGIPRRRSLRGVRRGRRRGRRRDPLRAHGRRTHAREPQARTPVDERRPDRHRQPPPLRPATGGGVGAARAENAAGAAGSSMPTRSSRSTTRSATCAATNACARWRNCAGASPATRAWSRVSAARNWRCCCPAAKWRRPARWPSLLRMAVADAKMPHLASPVAPYVTVSVGVSACIPDAGTPPISLVAAADRAMYATEAGRAQPGARGARRPADVGGAQPGRPARSRGAAAMSSGKNASNAASISASFARSTGGRRPGVRRGATGAWRCCAPRGRRCRVRGRNRTSRALPSAARSRAGAAAARR